MYGIVPRYMHTNRYTHMNTHLLTERWFIKLIGWKDKEKTLLVDPDEISILKTIERLNEAADSIYELYKETNPANEHGSVWKDIVLSPTRLIIQKELKISIKKAEAIKEYI